MSTDSDGSHNGSGNEEFERLVQAVKRELKDDDEFNLGERNVISRRGALAGLLGAGSGLGIVSMTGDVQAAGEDFSNASGTVGTDSKPLTEVNVKQAHMQSATATDIDAGSYTVNSNNALLAVAASGSVTLSSGTATVDTGISASGATFYLALGVDDPNADVNLAGKLFWDDSAGTYKITIDEVDTSVGNPTANYDVFRVR